MNPTPRPPFATRRRPVRKSPAMMVAIFLALAGLAQPAGAGTGTLANDGTLSLQVSFRFPPGQDLLDEVQRAVTGAARLLCDATDGQMRIGDVSFVEGGVAEDQADVWIPLEPGRSTGGVIIVENDEGIAVDVLPGLGQLGAHILWTSNGLNSATLAHELGHYVFSLGEQYAEAPRSGPFLGEDCGIGPGFELDFSDPTLAFDAQNNSIMGSGITRCLEIADPDACDTDSDPDCIVCSVDDDCTAGRACMEIGSSAAEDGTFRIVGAYSELSVPSNHDLRRGTDTVCPPGCSPVNPADCPLSFNDATDRFEGTQQTLVHDESDWETLERLYPAVFQVPAGLPEPDPGDCATEQPDFVDQIGAVDQAILLIDRSGSMGRSVSSSTEEVCDNGKDDDEDGTEDENDCAQSRLDYAKAAARAFVDLQEGFDLDLGVVVFNDTASVRHALEPLTPATADAFKDDVDAIGAGGDTAIGQGIALSADELLDALDPGKTQTVILLSDGKNNAGTDPLLSAQSFKDDVEEVDGLPRIFTVPVSDAADEELLAELAADPAKMIQAPTGAELPAIYAELAAVYRGDGLVLPRTDDTLFAPTETGSFDFTVEPGADALTVFIGARNARIDQWDVGFALAGPSATFNQSSCQSAGDPYYCFLRIEEPAPGPWTLVVVTASTVPQSYTVLASVENPRPDCFVDLLPRVQTTFDPTLITAATYYLTALDGDVDLAATVRRPDGTSVPVTVGHHARYPVSAAPFDDYVGRGIYEVRLTCDVPPGTEPAAGEPIFEGPEQPEVDVVPFVRHATASLFLAAGDLPPCSLPDCDGDGIFLPDESCTTDTDLDGRPDCRDPDADGDETPDSVEGTVDTDLDGIPDHLDPDSDGDGIGDPYDPDRTTPAGCDCGAPDAIRGTPGDDRLAGTPGPDILCGLEGNDRIRGGGGDDCIDAGAGRDRVDGGRGDDTVLGGAGGDSLLGGPGADVLLGGAGADLLEGGTGDDLLVGNGQGDRLSGREGSDRLFGGDGDDRMLGGPDGDLVDGGAGDDRIHGGRGFDTCMNGENQVACDG